MLVGLGAPGNAGCGRKSLSLRSAECLPSAGADVGG